MTGNENAIERLRREVAEQRAKLKQMEELLQEMENDRPSDSSPAAPHQSRNPLELEEYERYGRQMLVPPIGLPGQLALKKSKVLIVGAGGLGCPAAVYIAGAGVGTLGVIDGDVVEISNLHRQILHSTAKVGQMKVDSVIKDLRDRNPLVEYRVHRQHLDPETALHIFPDYDLIVDCTDHPAVRYLISDAAVLLGKPVVSASALRTEGQLIVLNHPAGKGPCYRCIWPTPPPAETVTSCGEGGILGPVVGTMGVLQALEVIKTLIEMHDESFEGRAPVMTIMSTFPSLQFRHLKMRPKRPKCAVCGEEPTITAETLLSSVEYIQYCGGLPHDNTVKLLAPSERITVSDYNKALKERKNHVLIDVRPSVEYGICKLPSEDSDTINIPMRDFEFAIKSGERPSWVPEDERPVYFVCRMGNDSQIAAQKFSVAKESLGWNCGEVKDIAGGLKEWSKTIDRNFPVY